MHKENIKKKRNQKIGVGVAILIFLVIVYGLFSSYILGPNDPILKKIHLNSNLPVAWAAGRSVELGDYYSRVQISENLLNRNLTKEEKKQILEKLIEDKIVDDIARLNKIKVSKEDLDKEHAFTEITSGQKNPESKLGVSKDYFKREFLLPQIQNRKIAVMLSSSGKLNKDQYARLHNLEDRLKNGEVWEDLVKLYSEDQQSSRIGGDLGFVGQNDLLPEYFNEIQKINDNNYHVANSRLGIHYFKVEGKDQNGPQNSTRYRIRHIFIRTQDYSSWLEQQKVKYGIIKLKHNK